MSPEQEEKSVELIIQLYALKKAQSYSHKVIYTGFWSDIPFDVFKINYKQWWKPSRTIKIKRPSKNTYFPGDICRVKSRYDDSTIYLLTALEWLSIPKVM